MRSSGFCRAETRTRAGQPLILRVVTCMGLLACATPALAADSAAKPVQVQAAVNQVQPAATSGMPIAHSALLTVDATPTDDSLELQIRRVNDKSVVSSEDVTVTVDGKNESLTRGSSGSYQLPIADFRGEGAREVDIVVAHDGIREILSGKVTLPQASSAGSLFRDHKQIAWWILNIVIVLIAALAISRRKG
jgi:hypothetical protein